MDHDERTPKADELSGTRASRYLPTPFSASDQADFSKRSAGKCMRSLDSHESRKGAIMLCFSRSIKSWADDAHANLPTGKVDSRKRMWLPIGSNQTGVGSALHLGGLCAI